MGAGGAPGLAENGVPQTHVPSVGRDPQRLLSGRSLPNNSYWPGLVQFSTESLSALKLLVRQNACFRLGLGQELGAYQTFFKLFLLFDDLLIRVSVGKGSNRGC